MVNLRLIICLKDIMKVYFFWARINKEGPIQLLVVPLNDWCIFSIKRRILKGKIFLTNG